MAEEKEAKEGGGSPLVRTIIIAALVILVPAIAGLAVFNFALRPMLAAPEEGMAEDQPQIDLIAAESVSYEFPDEIVHVANDDPNLPDMVL